MWSVCYRLYCRVEWYQLWDVTATHSCAYHAAKITSLNLNNNCFCLFPLKCVIWRILIYDSCVTMIIQYQVQTLRYHYGDVIMDAMAPQITSLTIVYSTVYSGADQRKHQGSASLGFVRGIHRWPVNSPHKGPVTRKMFPFDDVIMWNIPMTQ